MGASIILLAILGASAWGVVSLKDDVIRALDALPEAARRAREMVSAGSGSGPAADIRETAEVLGGGSPGESVTRPAPDDAPQVSGGSPVGGLLQRGAWSLFALSGHMLVIFFLIFFVLLSGPHVRRRLIEISGPDVERRRTAAKIIDEINAQIQRFLLVRLVTAVAVGALTWAVLAWMDVANAVVWGILAGAFNSIPYFGPVIVSGGLLIVGLLQGGGMTHALQMSSAATGDHVH